MNRVHLLRPLQFSVIAALAATSLTAQINQDNSGEPVYELEAFQVSASEGYAATSGMFATGFNTSLIQTPIAISLVTEEFLRDTAMDNLGTVASYMSGVTASEEDESGQGPAFYVRGFRSKWANRNGMRRYSVNGIDNIARFEVVKGPAAVNYGEVAPGGIVNIVTKRPLFADAKAISIEAGSYDFYRAIVEFDEAFGSDDQYGFRTYVSLTDSGGWRDFTSQERTFFYAGLGWKPTRKIKVYLEYETLSDFRNVAPGVPYGNREWIEHVANPPADLLAYARANPDNVSQYRAVASASTDEQARQRLSNVWTQLTGINVNSQWRSTYETVRGTDPESMTDYLTDLYPQGYEINLSGPDGFIDTTMTTLGTEVVFAMNERTTIRSMFVYDERENRLLENREGDRVRGDGKLPVGLRRPMLKNESWQFSLQGVTGFTTGPVDHDLFAGVSRYYDKWRPHEAVRREGFKVPATFDPRTDEPLSIGESVTGEYILNSGSANDWEMDSVYATHVGRFWKDRFITLLGARYQKVSNKPYGGSFEKTYSAVTPMMGFTFEIIPDVTIFASRSEAYSPNQGLVDLVDPEEYGRPEELDVNVPDEESAGFDIGIKTAWRDNTITGSVSYFEVEIDKTSNRIVDQEATESDPRNNDENPDNDVSVLRFASGDFSSGIEMDVVFTPSDNYQLQLAYTYLNEASFAENKPGIRKMMAPLHELGIWNKYSFLDGFMEGFEFGMGMRYRDEFVAFDLNPELMAPSSTVFDGLVRYKTRVRDMDLSISLNIKNIFDKRYIISGPNLPGDARLFRLNVTLKF